MTYVITQSCCSDASCVVECPVDCIRPAPEDPGFVDAEMLYIDPDSCIDCGACVDACPVEAIFPAEDLSASLARYADVNADYFARYPLQPAVSSPARPGRPPEDLGQLRVAIVGSGPAAAYAAEELLTRANAAVDMFEKLPTPWGLLRSGVAPDHQHTKGAERVFDRPFRSADFEFHLNVEVGVHVVLEELLEHHHAVIYAVGASNGRPLDVPGHELRGSHTATEFVAWYNGHPDFARRTFDLSGERAVIVGNGNVALDVARILTTDPEDLAKTDIADHALEALRRSNIREVVILGRRGPLQAAYTAGEFMALGHLPHVEITVAEGEAKLDPSSAALVEAPDADPTYRLKATLVREYAGRGDQEESKRIVFRYLVSPAELCGTDAVESVRLVRNHLVDTPTGLVAEPTEITEILPTTLVLASTGYRGTPIADLPFDMKSSTVPNLRGRVIEETGSALPGVYVTGWIKRGATGGIGSNRFDAAETVDQIIEDFQVGKLNAPLHDRTSLRTLIASHQPDAIGRDGWRLLDSHERALGALQDRPRIKLVDRTAMVAAATGSHA